jgi:citrate synthase
MIFNKVVGVITHVFNINRHDVNLDLGYQQIQEWDSLNHIRLMLALENEFDIKIDENTVLALTSVANICTFLKNQNDSTIIQELHKQAQSKSQIEGVYRGLNGVFYDYSTICLIDGINGKLFYRGYPIENLVENYCFEEIISLLLLKRLPDNELLNMVKLQLYEINKLPKKIVNLIKESREFKPIEMIKLVIAYYSGMDSSYNTANMDIIAVAFRMFNLIPLIIGQHNLFRNGIDKIATLNPKWSYAKNVLFLLTMEEPNSEAENYFDKDLILHAEHDSNASTFVARICTSTKSAPLSCLLAAISAFSGELHGGALEQVAQMMQQIDKPKNVEKYIMHRLENQLPVYGYGHRIYKTLDPRAKYMDTVAKQLSIDKGNTDYYEILHRISACMKPYSDHGIYPNVDFYDAVIYKLLNITDDLFLPAFIISRLAGWFAHMEEQHGNNILIRPKLKFKEFNNEK